MSTVIDRDLDIFMNFFFLGGGAAVFLFPLPSETISTAYTLISGLGSNWCPVVNFPLILCLLLSLTYFICINFPPHIGKKIYKLLAGRLKLHKDAMIKKEYSLVLPQYCSLDFHEF